MVKKTRIEVKETKTMKFEATDFGFLLSFDDVELFLPVRKPEAGMFLTVMRSPSYAGIENEYKDYEKNNKTFIEAHRDATEEYEAAKHNYETALKASLTSEGTVAEAEVKQQVMERCKVKLDTLERIKKDNEKFVSQYSVQDVEGSLNLARSIQQLSYLSRDSYVCDVFEELSKQITRRIREFQSVLDSDTIEVRNLMQDIHGGRIWERNFRMTAGVYGTSEQAEKNVMARIEELKQKKEGK
ncbi:hypothetical protein E0M25_21330 [Bacillus mycoides]|uniref:hypothetical protein n=1 Tax=Bacillus mycoides TaxID=1405 RepID=UPI00103E56E2|nr:hypothetical protein [Bacillus mycoides]TBX73379.1 hypothetical protein E0M25_21330 [Bacillus mycoides]